MRTALVAITRRLSAARAWCSCRCWRSVPARRRLRDVELGDRARLRHRSCGRDVARLAGLVGPGPMSERYRLIFRSTGGPEVIEREPLGALVPGPGEVLVRHEAIGLNFIDTYHRSGLYPAAAALRASAARRPAWSRRPARAWTSRPGERVGYALGPAGRLCHAPADRRPTGWCGCPTRSTPRPRPRRCSRAAPPRCLVERCARVQAGDWVLVHAAAGGVGSILVPWLKAIGARVIAHAGSAEKAAIAPALGADHALSCPFDELAEAGDASSPAAPASHVFDGVGAASWAASLASLEQARPDGELRQCLRAGAAVQPARAGPRRLAVPDPADARRLCRDARASCRPRPRGCSR